MVIASAVSIVAFFGAFGPLLAAFSPFLALAIAFVLSPVICALTGGKYYLARTDDLQPPMQDPDGNLSTALMTCVACGTDYERPDMAACPFHEGPICSLCCTLENSCGEVCKPEGTAADLPMPTVRAEA
jgi:hypothetical protein